MQNPYQSPKYNSPQEPEEPEIFPSWTNVIFVWIMSAVLIIVDIFIIIGDKMNGPTHSDLARIAQRVATLEDFQNQTLTFTVIISLLAGIALGFIWAKYVNKKDEPKSFKFK